MGRRPYRKLTRQREGSYVARHATGGACLDVGCGRRESSQAFPHALGLDLRAAPGTDVVGSVQALPFADNSFAVVLLLNVVEHLADPPGAVRECLRVLRPGGRLLVSVPFIYPLHLYPADYVRYTPSGLRHLLAAAEAVTVEPMYTTPETLAVLCERIVLQTTYSRALRGVCHVLSRLLWRLPSNPRQEWPGWGAADDLPLLTAAYFCVATKAGGRERGG